MREKCPDMNDESIRYIFDRIYEEADKASTCLKVTVGAQFIPDTESCCTEPVIITSNSSIDKYNCKKEGKCYKAELTGIYESCEETRKYCKATHAEINLLKALEHLQIDPSKGVLYVTRYPCYNCAKECVKNGIKQIVYAGRQEISDDVKKLFSDNNVSVTWYPGIDYEN